MLWAIPSLRHSSAMLTSPRRPSSTMRIFSSAEYCRRVALRMSRTNFSAPSGLRPFLSVIVIPPWGYDEPGTLAYAISSICPVSADGEHRHGTIILRFRWGRYRLQMNEPLGSQEFKAHYAILRAKVEAAKAGLEVDFGFPQKAEGTVEAPVPAKARTFRWLCDKF